MIISHAYGKFKTATNQLSLWRPILFGHVSTMPMDNLMQYPLNCDSNVL